MTHNQFLAAFESATLARADWTHEAHVRMASLYLTRHPFTDVLEKARAGIRQLNLAFNPQDRCQPADPKHPPGYNDTITVAFVRVIAGRLEAREDYGTFCERNPDLFDRSLSAVRKHYTKKLLFSAKARKAFVEPNREPLPAVGPWGADPQTGHKPATRRSKKAVAGTSA